MVLNLLTHNFTATKLNEKWVTEFRGGAEKLYLLLMMSLANQEVIVFETTAHRHISQARLESWLRFAFRYSSVQEID